MKKRILGMTIALCMLLSMSVIPAHAEIVDEGACGDDLTWTLDDNGTLIISGTGEMDYWFLSSEPPWYWSGSDIENVVIRAGVTSIGDNAFCDCESLISIAIPNSITSIGHSAFSGCKSITNITIPDGVTSIERTAFYDCNSLTSIEIPNSVTSIGDDAFCRCNSLTSIEIPNSVTSIGGGAFYDCNSLTSIAIPNSVTSIGNGAFYDCNSLTSIAIPNSVTSIGGAAFYRCNSLTSIAIPNSVTSIANRAFFECDSLTDVYYNGSESEWANINIDLDCNECLMNSTIHYNSYPGNVTDNEQEYQALTALRTQEEAVKWIKARKEEAWAQDYDGTGGYAQCVDLIKYYFDSIVGYSLLGSGYEYVGRTDLPDGWYYTQTPSPGDIAVWGKRQGIARDDGHVALVESVGDGTFNYVDVNGATGLAGKGTIENANPSGFIHPYFAPKKDISVQVNGNALAFDQPPIIQDGRTLVPLRAIFEALGAIVDWNGDTQTVTANKDKTTVKISIGDNRLFKNGNLIELDVPAQIINDRTLVPVRAISEAFGCKVDWDGDTKTVSISPDNK